MEHFTTSGADATPRRHNWAVLAALIGVVAIVALAAVLRLEGLGRDGLWYDETGSLQYARWPITHPRHWNNGMVLYHTMLHVWIRVAGESEAALRFPSAVFGIAAVAFLIVLVRRINGWPAALMAGLMLTLAWRHVYYSQEARAYSLFIMLAILSTLLLVRLLERPGAGRLIAYGIALVALAYAHYQWIFILAFHNLAVLISRRRVGWGWLMLHVVVAVAYVPQMVLGILPQRAWSPFYIAGRPGIFSALWALQDFLSLPLHQTVAGPLPAARDVNVLALYLLPLVAMAGIVGSAQPVVLRLCPGLRRIFPNLTRSTAPAVPSSSALSLTWLPLVWFAAVFVLPFIIAQTGKPIFRPRYAAGTLPVYCWFIGLAVVSLPRWWQRIPLAAFCALLTVPALETMKAMPMREDWRGCAEAITREEQPGDHIVLSHFRIKRPFSVYYQGSLPMTGVSYQLVTNEEITSALAWAKMPLRVWLVVSHNPTPVIIDYFKRREDYRLVSNRDLDYRGIALMLFERVGASGAPDG